MYDSFFCIWLWFFQISMEKPSSSAQANHFLPDCDKFNSFAPHQKRKTVVDANRCLNCLSRGHYARECKQSSKCRQC